MKKKNSDIFQQALGEATHKPTDNWEKELDKAKQVKTRRLSKKELVRIIEELNDNFDTKTLMRTNRRNLELLKALLANKGWEKSTTRSFQSFNLIQYSHDALKCLIIRCVRNYINLFHRGFRADFDVTFDVTLVKQAERWCIISLWMVGWTPCHAVETDFHRDFTWVLSSAGRASPLQGECRRFDPVSTHHCLKSFKTL